MRVGRDDERPGWSEAAFRSGRRAKAGRADELAAEGETGERIAAELGVSAATMYSWRRQFGGMDTDAAQEFKELARRERAVEAVAKPRRTGEARVAGGGWKFLSPAAKRHAVDMLRHDGRA